MFPKLSTKNFTYRTRRKLKYFTQFFSRATLFRQSTHVQNLHFRNLSRPHARSLSMSTLQSHIKIIVLQSSKQQMLGVHTSPIVALMQNKEPILNGAFKKFVRQSMSKHCSLIHTCSSHLNLTIASFIKVCGPNPTSFSLSNFYQKSIFYGSYLSGIYSNGHPMVVT